MRNSSDELVDRLAPLALLGEIAVLLAHEYNNLMTPLLGYASSGAASGDPEFQAKALQRCLGAAQQAQHVSAGILSLARQHPELSKMFHMEHFAPEPAEPLAAVEAALGCLGRDLRKDKIEVEIDYKPAGMAAISSAVLQHILLNLVLNARKQMLERGGTLGVKIRSRESGGESWVVVKVSDTGPGVERDQLETAFGPALRIRRAEGESVEAELLFDRRAQRRSKPGDRPWQDIGTTSGGYGLVFCRRMVELVGGTMMISTEVGKGTTISVLIPSATDASQSAAA